MMKTFGLDVSLYQKGMDFNKAKAEGVKYVIIKCSESNFADPEFENHYAAATKAGLDIGAYHYMTSTTKEGVIKEAKFAAQTVGKKKLPYPLFVDVEDGPLKKLGKDKLTELVKTFCETLESEGFWAGFYTNWDWYNHYLDGATLGKRFSFWLAFWGLEMPKCEVAQMWQYGGSTNFIRSPIIAEQVVDQDYCFVDYPSMIKARGKNNYPKQNTKPAPAPTPKPETLKAGDAVRMDKNAPVYGYNYPFQPWVYNETLYILEIQKNDRVVFSIRPNGPVTGAVDIKYLHKV